MSTTRHRPRPTRPRGLARRLAAWLALPLAAGPAAAQVATVERPLALAERTLRVGTLETAGGSELVLSWLEPAGVAAITPPVGRTARLRDEPVALARAGELSGLAWLEGATRQSYAVRYAPRSGESFGPIEEVAPPGPGSQLALTAAELADGRILLVWAGFDGQDDEILFALRGAAGGWSAPARIDADDELPDITPAATATGEGALVAWSAFDGEDYRVAAARFDGERFRPARWIGPPASLYPAFEPGPGEPLVVYRNARPRGWSIAELDRSGAVRRQAFVASDEREPPAILERGATLRLGWGQRRVETPWR
jgi:hypothetical protein